MIRPRRLASFALALIGAIAAEPAMTSVGSELIGSPHDFVRGTARADETQLCVFCHTPYGARASPQGPLWQRGVQPNFTFATYATQDDPLAAQAIGFDVAGMSVVCLSCHDAGQAATVTSFANEHPFGVPYRGAREGSRAAARSGAALPVSPGSTTSYRRALSGALAVAIDEGEFRLPNSAVIDGRVVWWASLQPPGSRRTRADLPLYTRREGAMNDETPYVECGSCHDPHSTNALFLRVTRENSLLCLTCHQK